MRLLLILLLATPCFAQAPGRAVERGSAKAAQIIVAGRMNELKAISSGWGTPLYKTDVKLTSREHRKAEQFAMEAAKKLIDKPRQVKAANISADRRRVAFKDLASDALVAINVRKRPSGEFIVNKAEVLTKQMESVEGWLEKVSVFADDEEFNRNQMITEATHNFTERRTVHYVRNPNRTRDLYALMQKDGVRIFTQELFAGKVDGSLTSSYINPK